MLTKQQELLILSSMRSDSRQSLTLLSRKTRIPVSTLHERLKRFHSEIIQRNTALLDFPSLGFAAQVTLLLAVNRDSREDLKTHLFKSKVVNSCYRINNGFDFFVEAVFRNMHEAEKYIEDLEQRFSLRNKHVHYVMDVLKREAFLSSPEYIKLTGNFS